MNVNIEKIADFLLKKNNFYILTHQYPDGDTLGSAYALSEALQRLGKKAKVLCSDIPARKFDFLKEGVKDQNFDPETIITVDIADTALLGQKLFKYSECIDVSIDHHLANKDFAKLSFLNSKAAANAENIYKLVKALGVSISKSMAACIYTGISTDTGRFKYTNATPESYRICAEMIEHGANAAFINRMMFDIKSREKIQIERMVLDSMEFYCNSKCAIISLTNDMIEQSGANDNDVDGLASIPRQVDTVLVGITLREKQNGEFKVSIRTDEKIDASKICLHFGGGGHMCAAGCTISGDINHVKKQLLNVVSNILGERI